jgi:aspartate oxidase
LQPQPGGAGSDHQPHRVGQPGVWLDSLRIDLLHGKGTVKREFPAMFRQFHRFGIDMSKEPVLIYPTLHYQNGGIAIHPDGSTKVPGLYVAGEASGGVHGRNRLMGNSLLDIVVFGRRAGFAAGQYVCMTLQAAVAAQRVRPFRLRANLPSRLLSFTFG